MARVRKKNINQLNGIHIKDTTGPTELQEGTEAEQIKARVPSYPYSGYHRTTIGDYLNGGGASPYSRQNHGGTESDRKGLYWYNRHVQRTEMMLQATGEPAILFRRKWTGEVCPCYDGRRGQARNRCDICFGTGFVGGYVRYVNCREPEGRILLRVGPTEEDLDLQEDGMRQKFIPACWTLPEPIVRDRDVIILFDPETGEETWRYEILSVERNRGMFRRFTLQKFNLHQFEKTDPIYNVEILGTAYNAVGDLTGPVDPNYDPHPGYGHIDPETGYGEAYEDRGFSEGYIAGYGKGYEDRTHERDFDPILDENWDGKIDTPYGRNDPDYDEGGKQNYMSGWEEGYRDGWRDKEKELNPGEAGSV